MQQQQYTAYSPVTTYQTQIVDQGSYVNQVTQAPGKVCNNLAWFRRGYRIDPASNQLVWQRGGLHWTPTVTPGPAVVTAAYVPNYVAQQVPVTSYQAQNVIQETPITTTRYVDEVVTQQVPVQVQRIETTEECREVPVTVQRPVTERIAYKVPVQTTRWEQQEMVRQIPVTTQRIEYEEKVEETPVQVCRMVAETSTVQVPRTEAKWVAETGYRMQPRLVAMRVPLDGTYDSVVYEGATQSVQMPVLSPTGPVVPGESRRLIESRVIPQASGGQPTPANPPADADAPPPANREPADRAPSLRQRPPAAEVPAFNPPANGRSEEEPADEEDAAAADENQRQPAVDDRGPAPDRDPNAVNRAERRGVIQAKPAPRDE